MKYPIWATPASIVSALKSEHGREIAKGLLIALCVLLSVFGVWRVVQAVHERNALRTEVVAAQGQVAMTKIASVVSDKVVTQAAADKVAIAKVEAPKAAATEKALAANPAWAEQPIPKDILDSLND